MPRSMYARLFRYSTLELTLTLWIAAAAAGMVVAGAIHLLAPERFLALEPLPKSLLGSLLDRVVDTLVIDLVVETVVFQCFLLLLIKEATLKIAR